MAKKAQTKRQQKKKAPVPKKPVDPEKEAAAERRRNDIVTNSTIEKIKRIHFWSRMGADSKKEITETTNAVMANMMRCIEFYLELNKTQTVTVDAVRAAYQHIFGRQMLGVTTAPKKRQKKKAAQINAKTEEVAQE